MNAATPELAALDELPAGGSPGTPQSLKLSSWLRGLGAASFAGAGASFLVEGWTDPGILKRQLLWALGTLMMSAWGIVSIRRFRDATGARVCLGLAAATIPAHFAQVGASVWALHAEGLGTLGQVLAAGAIVLALAPPLALGISALVRGRARLIVALMFVTGCPLILPTRNGDLIALLGVFEIGLCLAMEAAIFRRDALFRTTEGICARILLFLPCAILLIRNAFYADTSLWLSAIVGVPSLALFVLPRLWSRTDRFSAAAQIAGVSGLCVAAMIAVPTGAALALLLSVIALLGSELTVGRHPAFAWGAASLLGVAGVASFIDPSAWMIIVAVPVGMLHVLSAFRRRSVGLTITTSMVTIGSVMAQLIQLVRLPAHDFWVPAAVLSVGFLVLASILEHHRDRVHRYFSGLSNHFLSKG